MIFVVQYDEHFVHFYELPRLVRSKLEGLRRRGHWMSPVGWGLWPGLQLHVETWNAFRK